MSQARIWIAGTLVAALSGAMFLTGTSGAADEKEVRDGLDKIVAALQKGDKDGAKKQAEALAKKLDDVADAMDLFKPRKKKGWGVGDKAGAVTPDGIEQLFIKIGRDAPAAGTLNNNSAAFEQMGYRMAAVGLVAQAKGPPQTGGKKSAKDWTGWSGDTVESGIALAAAAKGKAAQDVKTAAAKANNACNSCHTVFR